MKLINFFLLLNKRIGSLGSILMKCFLRINGAKIGRNTYVSLSSRIVAKKSLVIGNDCVIKSHVKIKANNISIGHNCIISEDSYITGDDNFFLGNKSFVGKKVRINVSKNVTIGEDVGVGENTTIWTHGYFPPADEGYPVTYSSVSIGDGTWVSTNIIILPGVKIGKNVIIGAGSVVTKNVDDESLIAGNPAKFLKKATMLKSTKPFIEIVDEIFANYSDYVLVEKNKDMLKYKIDQKSIYVCDGTNIDLDSIEFPKGSLIIFKNFKNSNRLKTNDFYWFDLTSREMTSAKLKEINALVDILRSYGIRFVKKYSYA